MAFDSLSDLWNMAGHGPYVWTCYAVFLAALIVLSALSVSGYRRQLRELNREQQRSRKIEQSPSSADASAGSFGRVKTSNKDA